MAANPQRDVHMVGHFFERTYLPDELIETVGGSTFDHAVGAPPTFRSRDEDKDKDPRRVATRKLDPTALRCAAPRRDAEVRPCLVLVKVISVNSAPFDVTSFPMHKSANVIASVMRMLLSGIVDGKRPLSRVSPFEDHDGLVAIFESYRSTTDLKTIVDFRD